MQAKRYTHADYSVGGFRHVSEFLPDHFKAGDHFASADFHARQVVRATGQSKFQHTKNVIRHLLEGLK